MDVLELTKQLIACQSITPQDAGCQTLLKDALTNLGFQTVDVNHSPVSNFWAWHGDAKPCFVFAGHTDVVSAGDLKQWQSDPFIATEKDELLFGRGVADMKGAIAAMLVATERFIKDYPEHRGQMAFLITSAEEGDDYHLGTPKVMDYLQRQGIAIDYCLIGEPSSSHQLGDAIKIGRRGSLNAQLTIKGKQGHIAYPHLAHNPIHAVASAIQQLTTTEWCRGDKAFPATSFQISNIHAGDGSPNIIPGECQLRFNFRYSDQVTAEQLQQKVEAILSEHQLDVDIDWRLSGPPFVTRDNEYIDQVVKSVEAITGLKPELSTSGGTSDGRFIAPSGAQVIELGLCNSTIHQINEHIVTKDLHQLTEIYYQLLCQLLSP